MTDPITPEIAAMAAKAMAQEAPKAKTPTKPSMGMTDQEKKGAMPLSSDGRGNAGYAVLPQDKRREEHFKIFIDDAKAQAKILNTGEGGLELQIISGSKVNTVPVLRLGDDLKFYAHPKIEFYFPDGGKTTLDTTDFRGIASEGAGSLTKVKIGGGNPTIKVGEKSEGLVLAIERPGVEAGVIVLEVPSTVKTKQTSLLDIGILSGNTGTQSAPRTGVFIEQCFYDAPMIVKVTGMTRSGVEKAQVVDLPQQAIDKTRSEKISGALDRAASTVNQQVAEANAKAQQPAGKAK